MKIQPIHHIQKTLRVPGDKSISHRAIMLGALADGVSQFRGFLLGEDCLSTIACFRQMGVSIALEGDTVTVHGAGLSGLTPPKDILYTGNSGTTTRLMAGILAGQPFDSIITGDSSIAQRPMARIISPLRQMGAHISGREEKFCPLVIKGSRLSGIEYRLPVASAQLKSCLLLAGLFAHGKTRLIEPAPSRNHTEIMLRQMGAEVRSEDTSVLLTPPPCLSPLSFTIPGDISSAAFFIVAALITKDSEITIEHVGINPTRTGILDVLQEMGADITLKNCQTTGEPVCDIVARSSTLHGTVIGGNIIPRLIDELPILAVAAAFAQGETIISDAAELKVKESNRITAMVSELSKAGVCVQETADGMKIQGGAPVQAGVFDSYHDHRIAMSMAVLALGADGCSELQHADVVSISYPGFFDILNTL